MELIVIIHLLSFSLLYFTMIVIFITGWRKIITREPVTAIEKLPNVSVIVPFRNEESSLPLLLQSLKQQHYTNFEVLLIDDHSTDNSVNAAKSVISSDTRFKIIKLDDEEGKKAAQREGVKNAQSNFLLFTDADCTLGLNWIQHMVSAMITEKAAFVSSRIEYTETRGFFSKLLYLEFQSLIATGAAAISLNRASLCNGASMAVQKELYPALTEIEGAERSSGDDIFMMHHLKRKGGTIVFNASPEASVKTSGPKTFGAFLRQRVRWASKSGSYHDFDSIFQGIIVLFMCIAIITSVLLAFSGVLSWWVPMAVFLTKTGCDFAFLLSYLQHYNKSKYLWYIVPVELLYPIYIIMVGILSLFWHPLWKGRKIR